MTYLLNQNTPLAVAWGVFLGRGAFLLTFLLTLSLTGKGYLRQKLQTLLLDITECDARN